MNIMETQKKKAEHDSWCQSRHRHRRWLHWRGQAGQSDYAVKKNGSQTEALQLACGRFWSVDMSGRVFPSNEAV